MATELRTLQGDTVDAICWRHYGRTADVTEAVYSANPELSELDVILPRGTLITLPEVTTALPADSTLHLWD